MKSSLFIQVLFITFSTFFLQAQQSFDFSYAQPSVFLEFKIANKYKGNYVSRINPSLSYEITDNDVLIHFTQYESMSKEYMDSQLDLYVIGDSLFGISEQPMPVVFDNGRYYFGVIKTTSLKDQNAVFRKTDEHSFVVNMPDNGMFMPRIFQFIGSTLRVADFDYSDEKQKKQLLRFNHTVQMEENMTHYHLELSQRNWEKLIQKGFFSTEHVFTKVRTED